MRVHSRSSALAALSVLLLRQSGAVEAALHVQRQSSTAGSGIPDFVTEYAPLVYLDVNDPYLPSDIGAQLVHTTPDVNFTPIKTLPSDYGLGDMAALNADADCTVDNFGACPIFLTSKDNVTSNPAWLYGVLPDDVGATDGAISCAVVVNDHGDGTVDAFYFYFYAFNLGLEVAGKVAGNHVGDWEHNMIRFVDGKPLAMWFSAHDGGFTYTYDAVEKKGVRPVDYSSLGGHANYATPGSQLRNLGIIQLNDTTSKGPLWDPVRSAYFYTYVPQTSKNGTFAAGGSTPDAPVDWLYFLGRWGDKQYPDSDPRQFSFAGLEHTWDTGPTGPLDKELNRTDVCPNQTGAACSTTSALPAVTGDPTPSQTISRGGKTATVGTTTSESPASSGIFGSSSGSASSSTTKSGGGTAAPTGYGTGNSTSVVGGGSSASGGVSPSGGGGGSSSSGGGAVPTVTTNGAARETGLAALVLGGAVALAAL